MNEFFFLSADLLSATQAWGGVASFFLLIFSFVVVHAVKLSSKGYLLYKQEEKKRTDETPAEKKPEQKPQPAEAKKQGPPETPAPVYYLVEKKRVRKKPAEYAEPQRIRFENDDR